MGKDSTRKVSVDPAHPEPSERDPASVNEGYRATVAAVKLEPDEWIKDSGCTRHMTGNKDLFSTYEAIDGGNVVFGSNAKSKIIGK
ncbi:hypothetical protein Tco_0068383, partial [Tanacetum coccineum]